jgi:Fe2+ transport system protein FeoA
MSIRSFLNGARLSAIPRGRDARILRVLHHERAHAQRLAAFGVVPGVIVTVLQTFPGVILRCDETELAIEPEVAHSIVVEIADS